jgi:hypothetical protein
MYGIMRCQPWEKLNPAIDSAIFNDFNDLVMSL